MEQSSILSVLNKKHIADEFSDHQESLHYAINHFDSLGYKVGKGRRNMVKHIRVKDLDLNVKSFKTPNPVNRLAYRFFRKSKARRSYEYARRLLDQGILTPTPVACFEQFSRLAFGRSFYISVHIKEDLTFRTLIEDPQYPEREEIIRQFTRFTHEMHEKGILFLDHSPGNTLIKKSKEGTYRFYLVDLNRMRHNQKLSFKSRMKNFARLTATDDIIAIMSREYASLTGHEFNTVYACMVKYTRANHERRLRQKRLNRQLGRYKP